MTATKKEPPMKTEAEKKGVKLLDGWEAETMRGTLPRAPNWCVGSAGIVQVKRSATCRECGQKIANGENAWEFFYDQGGGSWTALRMLIHEKLCTPIVAKSTPPQ